GFERGYDRLNPRRSPIGGALLLHFDRLLPRGELASALGTIAELAKLDLQRFPRGEAPAANAVHDAEPGDAEKERQGREPQEEQEHTRPEQLHQRRHTSADHLPDDPA